MTPTRLRWTSPAGYIAYSTFAGNLVAGGTPDRPDVLLYDQVTRRTRLVPTHPNADSNSPTLDAHGRRVAYTSDATNLVSYDTNNHGDVFVTTIARP